MRYAIVQSGVVVNVIEADPAHSQGGIASDTASPGDTWDGQAFTRPAPPQTPVPQSVTRRQARQALLLAGLLDQVQPAIDAIPNATRRALAQIEWEDSQVFERSRPVLLSLATALGLDTEALDALFITAATL